MFLGTVTTGKCRPSVGRGARPGANRQIGSALLLASCLVGVMAGATAATTADNVADANRPSGSIAALRSADAAIPSVSRAQALAAGCTPCHQAGVPGTTALSGQAREALRATLERFRDGTQSGTVMPQLVRGYTPEELDLIAQWFAAQRKTQ